MIETINRKINLELDNIKGVVSLNENHKNTSFFFSLPPIYDTGNRFTWNRRKIKPFSFKRKKKEKEHLVAVSIYLRKKKKKFLKEGK